MLQLLVYGKMFSASFGGESIKEIEREREREKKEREKKRVFSNGIFNEFFPSHSLFFCLKKSPESFPFSFQSFPFLLFLYFSFFLFLFLLFF